MMPTRTRDSGTGDRAACTRGNLTPAVSELPLTGSRRRATVVVGPELGEAVISITEAPRDASAHRPAWYAAYTLAEQTGEELPS
jgi:hypothetical protein